MTAATLLTGVRWQRSSRCHYPENQCVEIAKVPHVFAVRDSKNEGGTSLVFGAAVRASFLGAIRHESLAAH